MDLGKLVVNSQEMEFTQLSISKELEYTKMSVNLDKDSDLTTLETLFQYNEVTVQIYKQDNTTLYFEDTLVNEVRTAPNFIKIDFNYNKQNDISEVRVELFYTNAQDLFSKFITV